METYCLFKSGNVFFVALEMSKLYYDYCYRFGNPFTSGTLEHCIDCAKTF